MEKQISPQMIRTTLQQYCGTEYYYQEISTGVLYTDGIAYMVMACDAKRILRDVATKAKHLACRNSFVRITLTVDNRKGLLEFTDGNGKMLHEHVYQDTDFPLEILTMYFVDNTLLLPSEY